MRARVSHERAGARVSCERAGASGSSLHGRTGTIRQGAACQFLCTGARARRYPRLRERAPVVRVLSRTRGRAGRRAFVGAMVTACV